jgi:hypothetical protein
MSPLRVLTRAGGLSGGSERVLSDTLAVRLSRLLLLFAFLFVPVVLAHAQADLPAASLNPGLWERAAHFIVQPWATFTLLAVGCLFLFHEMLTPHTWGFSGNAGTLCIGLVIASEVTVGNSGWVGVLLLLVGLTLVLLEVHLYPDVRRDVPVAGRNAEYRLRAYRDLSPDDRQRSGVSGVSAKVPCLAAADTEVTDGYQF